MKSNKMLRMWVLYALFVGIALSCVGLFLLNVCAGSDGYHLDNLEQELRRDHQQGLIITDLVLAGNPYEYDTRVTPALQARTNTFDLLVTTDDAELIEEPLLRWTMLLQVLAVVCMGVILVLVAVLMVRMFRSIRQGRLFRKGGMGLLSAVGLVAVVLTLSLDTSTYLERQLAYRLLEGTEWEPVRGFTLHVTRLFCGLIVLFVAEVLRIGYAIQEDQDLTI